MKKVNLLLSALLICAFSFVACDKQNAEPLSKYDSYIEKYSATDELVTEPTVHEVIDEIMKTGLWDQKTVKYALTCDCTPDEKLEMLEHGASRNISEETGLETIARKNTGSVNVNGGQAYWDCSPSLLAQTISQVGTGVDPRAVNNFYNAGSSVNTITMSDVLRAANGVNNTAFDGIIEVADIVFKNEVSGGNWLVGAVIVYDGQEYLYSDFSGNLGSLIYDPQDGGAYLIGPMPGGITSIDITGQWTPPLSN
jgi:hypothetical protein